MLKRQKIKNEIRKQKKALKKGKWFWSKKSEKIAEKLFIKNTPQKDKEERRQDFFFNHPDSYGTSNKVRKLRCQITGCRNAAVTMKGKKKVCWLPHNNNKIL